MQTNGHAVAVWFNGSRLTHLPDKMPEEYEEGEKKEEEKNNWGSSAYLIWQAL